MSRKYFDYNKILEGCTLEQAKQLSEMSGTTTVADSTVTNIRNKVFAKLSDSKQEDITTAKTKKNNLFVLHKQSADTEWLSLSKSKRKPLFKSIVAVAMLAITVVGAFTMLPFLTSENTPPIIDNNPNTSATQDPNQNNQVFEPVAWLGVVDTPYAIVEIKEFTNETISLSQSGIPHTNYVSVNCEIVFSHHTDEFSISSAYNGSDTNNPKVTSFDALTEIYITEDSVKKLVEGDTILIQVVRMNMNGKYYYGPATNDEGCSEYLRIVKDQLQAEKDDYNTRSFTPFQVLNDTLDELKSYLNRGGKETDFTKALPDKKIGSGMTIAEIKEYFIAWDEAKRIHKNEKRQYSNIPT